MNIVPTRKKKCTYLTSKVCTLGYVRKHNWISRVKLDQGRRCKPEKRAPVKEGNRRLL